MTKIQKIFKRRGMFKVINFKAGLCIVLFFVLIISIYPIASVKADIGNFILSGGPNPTDNICVDDDIYVYLNDNLIYSDIDPYWASCNNSTISFQANFGDKLKIVAIDSVGICRGISPLWLHYDNQSVKLDGGKYDGCGWPAGVTFYDKTFTISPAKEVPLYTQVRSPYPSDDETKIWAELDYAEGLAGNYDCGYKIRQCGCAITSVVMIARYYDVIEAQEKDVNPGTINEWLKNEPGGYVNGDVNWIAGAKYTNWRIKYEKTDKTTNNYTLLDEKLNKNQSVIAKASAGRGGINRQHFFVIDGKLASTYTVKDPAWYNTKTLNETTNISNNVRGYENGFDGLRIYKKGDGIAQSAIIFALASPAEFLITDLLGRKLGKDANGIEYSEIPEAWYFEDGFDDPTGENPPLQERNKLIQILEPIDGEYQLQVIGIAEGDYVVQSNFYDITGGVNSQQFQSETAPGYVAQYNISFDSSNSANTTLELFDEIPPEAEIFFDPNTQQIEIRGIDNTSVNPTVSLIMSDEKQTIYQIRDEAENTTNLTFNKFKQEGKEIKAELNSVQYNNQPLLEFFKAELKYEWSVDKKTDTLKNLEQRIKVKDQFDVKAKYNSEKNETIIKIKLQHQEEQAQTLSGLVIIKLITKSGVLDFSY